MTNNRAVEIMKAIIFMLGREYYTDEVEEAIHMAINALKAQDLNKQVTGKLNFADDTISRQAAIDALNEVTIVHSITDFDAISAILDLPPIQPEKEIAKRVLWTGWKGCRNTRYKCPNCKKPVKNDDIYCHRCGQKLMFPHISFTDYVPGEKQETIVRWDDE